MFEDIMINKENFNDLFTRFFVFKVQLMKEAT